MAGTLADAALRLTQPDVSPTELTDIAAVHPDLRPAVAAHPNCHPELRAWIAQVTPPAPPPVAVPSPPPVAVPSPPPVAPPAAPVRPAPPAPPALSAPPAPPVLPVPPVTPDLSVPPVTPPSPVRRARLPWTVAAVAVVVALASVGVLVLRGSGESTAGGERGFASPEEAADYVVTRVAAGDAAGATEAFAVETLVDGFSFQAYGERVGVVTPQTWLPTSSAGYRAVDEGLRRGEVARQLQALVQSVVAPDRDFTMTQGLADDLTAADFEAELAPEGLAGLSVIRVDELNRAGDRYSEDFQAMAEPYGADELREVAVLYRTADGPALGGMQLLRFGDEWYVWNLTSALIGTGIGRIERTSEQEYLAAVAQVQG